MWIEDDPGTGTFTYRMVGFKEPPTDSYGRVQWLARREYDLILDYKRGFSWMLKMTMKIAWEGLGKAGRALDRARKA